MKIGAFFGFLVLKSSKIDMSAGKNLRDEVFILRVYRHGDDGIAFIPCLHHPTVAKIRA